MLWFVVAVLIIMAGLNAPLAACVMSFAALNGLLVLRAEFAWVGTPAFFVAMLLLLALQLLADLYFVPVTVKDRAYLHPRRTQNAYLHARVQSLFRPLVGAVVTAALPLPVADWAIAVFGFSSTTGVYWMSAWVREQVAIMRGAVVLLLLETAKNAALMVVALLLFWLPLFALALLLLLLFPVVTWSTRLQQEWVSSAYYGGHRAGEDT